MSFINVLLPKKFLGQEIIVAFKRSANFEKSFEKSQDAKWLAKEVDTYPAWGAVGSLGLLNKIIDPLADRLFKASTGKRAPKNGVAIYRSWKIKERWIEDFSSTIELLSLRPEDSYSTIQIALRLRAPDIDEDKWCKLIGADHKLFKDCRPTFEKFLDFFQKELGVNKLQYE